MEDPREVGKPLVEVRSAAGAVTACPVTAGGCCDPSPESRGLLRGAPNVTMPCRPTRAQEEHRSLLTGEELLQGGGAGGRVFRAALTRNRGCGGQTRAAPLSLPDQGLLGLLPPDQGLWETRGW